MDPAAIVVALGIAAWVIFKRLSQPPPSSVQQGGKADNAQEFVEEIEKQKANQVGGTLAVTSTALSGLAAAGLTGGLLGLSLGGVLALLFQDQPDDLDWPWHGWGMPYCTFGVSVGSKKGDVSIPIVAEDLRTPALFKINRALLENLLPGPNAVDHCLASGMFAWRPREVETPISKALYAKATWLEDYENKYLWGYHLWEKLQDGRLDMGVRPNGAEGSEAACGWVDYNVWGKQLFVDKGDVESIFVRSLHIMRRVYAMVALLGWDKAQTELYRVWDAFNQAEGSGIPSFASLTGQQPSLDIWKMNVEALTSFLSGQTPVIRLPQYAALRGFPGAWCFTAEPPTRTERSSGIPLAVRTSRPQFGTAIKPGKPVTAPAPKSSFRTGLKISVWLPSNAYGVWDDSLVNSRDSAIWGTHHVIPLQLFADSGNYASEAEMVAELAEGHLAWGPDWSERARDVWVSILPFLKDNGSELARTRTLEQFQWAVTLNEEGKFDPFANLPRST